MKKVYFLPKTVFGTASVGLTTIFVALIIIDQFVGGDTSPLWVGVIFTLLGLGSFTMCATSVMRYKDKAILLLVCGLLSLWCGVAGAMSYWINK